MFLRSDLATDMTLERLWNRHYHGIVMSHESRSKLNQLRLVGLLISIIFGLSIIAHESVIAQEYEALTSMEKIDLENTLYLDLEYGRVVIEMKPEMAPKHVARIKELVR